MMEDWTQCCVFQLQRYILTMLLAIPLVLCIIHMKNDKYTMVQYNTKKAMAYMYCMHELPIANAKIVDLHQQAGDI